MNMRRIKPEDIPTVNQWFIDRGLSNMVNAFPELGFIMEDDSVSPLAACFIYRDIEGRICWLAWLVTKPGLPPRQALSILKVLVAGAEHDLRKMGYPLMLATGRKGLGKLFTELAWQSGDLNVNQYFKLLR